MQKLDLTDDPGIRKSSCSNTRILLVVIVLLVLILVSVIIAFVVFGMSRSPATTSATPTTKGPSSAARGFDFGKPSSAAMGSYSQQAVSGDCTICSEVGNMILTQNLGNAVDAILATTICNGGVKPQHSGVGGGSFMLIYNRKEKKTYAIDFREQAPRALTGKPKENHEPASIGVPGEVSGLYQIWKRFGSVEWASLWAPTIKILRTGFPVLESTANANKMMTDFYSTVGNDEFWSYIKNNETGEIYKKGEIRADAKLADTMERISKDPFSFYNGSLSNDVISELKAAGSNITKEDLEAYETKWRTPVMTTINNDKLSVYSLPPPSNGAILLYMLNLMDGYNYTPKNTVTKSEMTLYYHRLLEAFKFAYAERGVLGDKDFVQLNKTIPKLLSKEYAAKIRSRIDDDKTHSPAYYEPKMDGSEDFGTSHSAVIDREGNAASVTSTINWYYGALIRGPKTGIFYNNEMLDFANDSQNKSGNLVANMKRPLSSMVPTIIVDEAGDVAFSLGASGGMRITTAVAQTIFNQVYLGLNVKEAVDRPRLHHQLNPDLVYHRGYFNKNLEKELMKKGHKFKISTSKSVISAIQRKTDKKGYLAILDPSRDPMGQTRGQ